MLSNIKSVWFAFKVCSSLIAFAIQCLADDPVPPVVDVPVASIVVTDATGMPVVDEIGLGQQITLSSAKAVHGKGPLSLTWIIEPKMQGFTIPVGTIDPDGKDIGGTVILTTPLASADLVFMQLVALGDKVAWQRVKIKCGQGAQPPPGPGPNPVPPTPMPTASKLFLAVVSDELKIPATALPILNAPLVWDSFRRDGGDWRFYDVTTGEAKGKKALADANAAGVQLPAFLVYDFDSGKLISATALPKSVADLKAAVAKFKGVAP